MAAALRTADSVVACSTFVADYLRSNDVRNVSIATPFLECFPTPTPVPRTPRLLFVGRIVPEKGLAVLLRALQTVEVELEVCGDGWDMASAQLLAERLGVAHRATFSGWLDEAALQERYRTASVVVVPSIWPEPFGMVGIEAMAQGRPVVASDTGGIRDWHEGATMGELVPPGDRASLAAALRSLVADPDRCQELGASAAAAARAFTGDRYLDLAYGTMTSRV